MSRPVVVVVGPTASGKSDLAIELALRFDGEVVNCDSVQVYKGLDVGTAKVPPDERRGVPHHLLDIVDPRERCTAGDYARLARPVLREISQRGKLPVIAGGTGFYLRALTQGLFEGPGRDEALRRRLEASGKKHRPGYLHRMLSRLDPQACARIHANDRPKLVRALEVCLLGQEPISKGFERGRDALEGFRFLKLGLDPPREALNEKINLRARVLFESGLVEEVRGLLAGGVPPDSWALGSHGYSQAGELINGRMTLEEAIESTALVTRQYSKRQRTWFRRQEPEIHWLEGFGFDASVVGEGVEAVRRWLTQSENLET